MLLCWGYLKPSPGVMASQGWEILSEVLDLKEVLSDQWQWWGLSCGVFWIGHNSGISGVELWAQRGPRSYRCRILDSGTARASELSGDFEGRVTHMRDCSTGRETADAQSHRWGFVSAAQGLHRQAGAGGWPRFSPNS